jgi:hypothetical protein
MVIKIYIPRCYLPGQELAPSPKLEGCQRVTEPDLSPLLYKSKPLWGYDYGITTKYCFKDKGIGLTFPNLIFLFRRKVKGERF